MTKTQHQIHSLQIVKFLYKNFDYAIQKTQTIHISMCGGGGPTLTSHLQYHDL